MPENKQEPEQQHVTQLLISWQKGNKEALDQLIPLVYQELHKRAQRFLQKERAGHTLQPTALIHEAYMRLIRQDMPEWQSRSHFFAVAAHIMRQILVDHARKNRSAKRGGQHVTIQLEESHLFTSNQFAEFLDFDQALRSLAEFDSRKSRILELRYFGGLSLEEIAEVCSLSIPTVVRDLRFAEAWLRRALTET